jgi:formylglycine-generating enzyme required for sulfatase activity
MPPIPSIPERRQLVDLLTEDLAAALSALRQMLPETAEKHAQVIALLARLKDANKERIRNTIRLDDYQHRIDAIRAECLDLINGLEEADFEPPAPAGKTAANDSKTRHGSVLYRVPKAMRLRKSSICTIRVAIDEDAILEDIVLDDNVRVRGRLEVSNMMRAELLDPEGEVFSIRPLNAAEQLVRDQGYTQWLFSVTPRVEGEHQLLVKVSMMEYNAQLGRYVPRDVSILETVTIVTEPAALDDINEAPLKSTGERLAIGPAAGAQNPQPKTPRPKAKRSNSPALRAMAFFFIFVLLGSSSAWAFTPPPTRDWVLARYVKDNEQAYQDYINRYQGQGVPRVEDAYFRKAEINPSLANLRDYQRAYPEGKPAYRVAVLEKIQTLELQAVASLRAQPDAAAILRFVQDFPESERLPELREAAASRPDLLPVLEQAYVASIHAQPSAIKVTAFLRDFPQSERLDEVRAAAAASPAVLQTVQPNLEDAYLNRLEPAPTAAQVQGFLERFPVPAQKQRFENILAKEPALAKQFAPKTDKPAEPKLRKIPENPGRGIPPAAGRKPEPEQDRREAAAPDDVESRKTREAAERVRQEEEARRIEAEEARRDTDGDGTPDRADRCPDLPGLTSLEGCPDADGDGITDAEDACPTEQGDREHKGCPEQQEQTPQETPEADPAPADSILSAPEPADGRRKSGLTMVSVPGGTFTMGCRDGRDQDCETDEKPAHSVTLSDFQIGKYEVTQADWRSVMGSDPPELAFPGCDDCPVESVSWDDIQEFLKKLNANNPGKNYRLPTEAEWEYAARGGAKSKGYLYAGGNDLDKVAWYNGNSSSETHPAGGQAPNELGLYDMSGNVWEWCSDWYGDYTAAAQTSPKGPKSGSYRVLRGGGWGSYAGHCRAASRDYGTPTLRGNNIGFRLALQ